MFKHYFESIDGIEIYPLFSLVVFFLFFAALIIWVFKVNKDYLRKMEVIPLENTDGKELKGGNVI
jgi:hypothetical protein